MSAVEQEINLENGSELINQYLAGKLSLNSLCLFMHSKGWNDCSISHMSDDKELRENINPTPYYLR